MQAVLRSTDFESLIASYVDTSEQRIDRLRALSDTGDLAALAREAHDLKGVAGNLGATEVQDHATRLDEALRSGDSTAANARTEPLPPEQQNMAVKALRRAVTEIGHTSVLALHPLPQTWLTQRRR